MDPSFGYCYSVEPLKLPGSSCKLLLLIHATSCTSTACAVKVKVFDTKVQETERERVCVCSIQSGGLEDRIGIGLRVCRAWMSSPVCLCCSFV